MLASAILTAGLLSAVPATAQAADHAARVPQCTNSDLRASYRPTGAAAGTDYGNLRLTNVSDHACRTGGYGGLSLVGDGDGTQIGAAAARDPGKVRTIVLQPGQRVRSVVGIVNAGNYPRRRCRPTAADGFRVYVPNATRSQFVAFETTGCANPRVEVLHHRPYRR